MKRKLLIPIAGALFALLAVAPFAVYAQDTATPESFPTVFQEPVTVEGFETATAVAVVTATPSPTPVVVVDEPPNPIPVDEPGEPPVTTPETLLGQLFAILKDGTFMLWAAAGVVVFVGLFKVAAQAVGITITGNGAVILTLVVQVVVWLGYAISNYLNAGDAFKQGYLIVVDIARSLLPLAGAIFAGHVIYGAAKSRSVPILGYKPVAKVTAQKAYTPLNN